MSISRVIAVFIVAVGALTSLHFIATVIYHDGSPEYPIWAAWNWVMAAAFVPMIAFTLRDKMAMQRGLGRLRRPGDPALLGDERPVLRRGRARHFVLLELAVGIQSGQRGRVGGGRATCRYGRPFTPSTGPRRSRRGCASGARANGG